jgi:hypothetical protein
MARMGGEREIGLPLGPQPAAANASKHEKGPQMPVFL